MRILTSVEYCPCWILANSCKIINMLSTLALLVLCSPGKLICFGIALDPAQLHVFFHLPELISPLGTCASGKCCSLTGSLVLTELINSSLLLAMLTWTGSWRSVWSFCPQVLLVRELTQQVWYLHNAASNIMSFVELNMRCKLRGGYSVWSLLGCSLCSIINSR